MKRAIVILCVCAFLGMPAWAGFTPINPGGSGEPTLTGGGGILDTLYGIGNLVRIDDDLGDQLWENLNGGAEAQAKWASANMTFGYFDSANVFDDLFTVPQGTNGYLPDLPQYEGGPTETHFSLPFIRWAVEGYNNSGTYFGLWSSVESDNDPGDNDHMVSWLITGGPSAGNYVVAWEIENLADADYQDIVVEISGVAHTPVPGAVLLGLLGLSAAGIRLRRHA